MPVFSLQPKLIIERFLKLNHSMKKYPWKWGERVGLACFLLLNSGCQPTKIPIPPISSASLSSTAFLPSPTTTGPSTTISPEPADTQPLIPSPPSMIFPLPQAVPNEAFQPPMVENVETHQSDGGAWTTYTPPDWQKSIQQRGEVPNIISIAEAPEGTLWFATTGSEGGGGVGVYRFDGKTWTHFRQGNGLQFNEINPVVVAPDGAIWFGSECCGVSRFDGKTWTNYTMDNGLASNDVRSMAFTPDGALWIGTSDKGVSRFNGKSWQTTLLQEGENYVGGIFILPDNSLLFSSSNSTSAKLIRFDGKGWSNYPTPWADQGKYTVDVIAAPNGDLWFTTEFLGVYRLSGNTWTNFTMSDLSSGDEIFSAAIAGDGSIWLGTTRGVSRFDGKKWTTFTLAGDTNNYWVGSIFAAEDGSIWLGYYGGIAHNNPPAAP